MDPIAAVTHPDPYPYYADLLARGGVHRDETLGLWVAVSAAAVTGVLTSDLCAVRPAAEPVPAALVGSAAGAIFGRLVRMIDGARHAALEPAVSAAVAGIERALDDHARRSAARLADELDPPADPACVVDFAFRLSSYALAGVQGIAPERLPEIASWVGDFVRAIAPGATAEQIQRGSLAAERLMEAFRARDAETVVANRVGLLSQAYEATAGLIGNTLVALGRDPRLHAAGVTAVVREVVRFDPPVQNTRRFVTRDGVVAGQPMTAGDVVLVVLAAANRDPLVNPEPERFDPFRSARTAFTFGAGPHACPGEAAATTIASAGVSELLARGVRPERLLDGLTYRPSVNTRIPLFTSREPGGGRGT